MKNSKFQFVSHKAGQNIWSKLVELLSFQVEYFPIYSKSIKIWPWNLTLLALILGSNPIRPHTDNLVGNNCWKQLTFVVPDQESLFDLLLSCWGFPAQPLRPRRTRTTGSHGWKDHSWKKMWYFWIILEKTIGPKVILLQLITTNFKIMNKSMYSARAQDGPHDMERN